MRHTVALLFIAVTAVAAPVPKVKSKKPDAEVFVGRWEAVNPGKEGEMYGKATWTIDDRLGLKIAYPEEDGRHTEWQIKLDPEKSPKEIDVGGFKGIYEFDGDDIRIADTSGERPTSFDPKPGVSFHVLRRLPEKDK